ncbi:MAG: Rpn family recombination-promoting nuclease/putative transposase [bacterium]|jgi:predicted transposase/invertase (TIGR01784 family)|nr:Rpn family recombination-promoting nuclease/putative transposase [bacterium]
MSTRKLIRFDWAIKSILRDNANFDVLEGFLSNLLQEPITVDALLESESNLDFEGGKHNRVDLQCRDSQNRLLIIEIQNQRQYDYLHRILWGSSKAVVDSIGHGMRYGEIVKVISISILYHPLPKWDGENTDFIYHGTTEMIGYHTKRPLFLKGKTVSGNEVLNIHCSTVFPEYYLIYVENFEDTVNSALDEWVYFFKHGAIQETFTSPGIWLAAKKLDYLGMNESERKVYERFMDQLRQDESEVNTAREEGRKEGRIEIALKMKEEGMREEQIAKFTGLALDQIRLL